MAKLLDPPSAAGSQGFRGISGVEIDSWEVGSQNWTPKFREAFQRLRGYDPIPYLPGELGWVVDNEETQRRFDWDFHMTVSDLLLENYAGHMRELANRNGMKLSIEGYFHVPAVELAYGGRADIPMAEFWFGSRWRGWGVAFCKPMAAVGHLYGKPVIAAEAFTAAPQDSDWTQHPAVLKPFADRVFAAGVNRMVFHNYAHQPWLDRAPGMTWQNGTHFNRNVTWWEQSRAWNQYLSRCQYLLQSGLFAADLCYLDIEESPRGILEGGRRNPPAGYDYDVCPAEVIQTRMSVRDGRIVLPDGMSYRLLVLPETERMTPQTLAKVVELARAGATIVATKVPTASPSLQNSPAADQQVRKLARELFGERTQLPETGVAESRCGAGRVFLARDLSPVLQTLGVKPDFTAKGLAKDASLSWIHRQSADADFYFIANGQSHEVAFTGAFRVADRQPELWHPETGHIRSLPQFNQEQGLTKVPLRLGPTEAVFVVFRKPLPGAGVVAKEQNFPELKPVMELAGPWNVRFDPKWGGPSEPVTFASLSDWSQRPEEGIKYYSGTAVYQKEFDCALPATPGSLYLDLGRVEVMAEVKLNGQEVGIAWKPPYRLEVTGLLKSGRNTLEVRAVNLWVNRRIGDEQLAEDAEWSAKVVREDGGNEPQKLKQWPQWLLEGKPSPTGRVSFSTMRWQQKNDPLMPSGLLGPVRVLAVEPTVPAR